MSHFLAGDSIFPTDGRFYAGPKIRRPAKSNEIPPETAHAQAFNDTLITLRQGAEWGMRLFQSAYPRLKTRLDWETKGFRKVVLRTATGLLNFRTRTVGLNQIKTTWANYITNPAEFDVYTLRLLKQEHRRLKFTNFNYQ